MDEKLIKKKDIADCVLVSYANNGNDETAILIVGRKNEIQEVDIINAFQGEEAVDIYKKLIPVKEEKEK